MVKLNLGSGHVNYPTNDGWINIDSNPETGCDIVAELPPIPLPDDFADHIEMSHFIEHVPDTIGLMNECWRVMKPGGHLHILVPYALSHQAFQDPTHVKFFVPESFLYYDETFEYLKYGIKRWSKVTAKLLPDKWQVEANLIK